MENLVITGLGAVTPIGIGVEEYWQGILDQKCGINRITRFQDENVPITIAGEVKGFDPKNYMPGKLAKKPAHSFSTLTRLQRKPSNRAGSK